MSKKEESEFGTKWIEGPKLVSLGGRWYEGVGIVQDTRGEFKVRIFKGEQKEGRPLPSQTQRLNVKKFSEWEALTPLVKEFCEKVGGLNAGASSVAEKTKLLSSADAGAPTTTRCAGSGCWRSET